MLSYITFHPVTDKNLKSSESETQWEIMKSKELDRALVIQGLVQAQNTTNLMILPNLMKKIYQDK